jgi:predicted cupin superfamily sugar epimerase
MEPLRCIGGSVRVMELANHNGEVAPEKAHDERNVEAVPGKAHDGHSVEVVLVMAHGERSGEMVPEMGRGERNGEVVPAKGLEKCIEVVLVKELVECICVPALVT